MAPVRGKRLGRYEIVRRLGAGGMGVVYQAYDPQLRRMIAIKFLADSTGGATESASPHLLHEAFTGWASDAAPIEINGGACRAPTRLPVCFVIW